jgi:hypothetical protein
MINGGGHYSLSSWDVSDGEIAGYFNGYYLGYYSFCLENLDVDGRVILNQIFK